MGCDLCGKDGQLFQAKVEGSVMTVCANCAKYGEVLKRIPTFQEQKVQAKAKAKETEARVAAGEAETLLLVRSDYAKLLKQARERLGLKQEDLAKRLNIKESQLHKYEAGHQPDLETARQLEKALRIKLIEEQVIEHGKAAGKSASGPLTIGDFLKVRKR